MINVPDCILKIQRNWLSWWKKCDVKRRGRKKTGMGSLNKMLKAILADPPLVQNLKNDNIWKLFLTEVRAWQKDVHRLMLIWYKNS